VSARTPAPGTEILGAFALEGSFLHCESLKRGHIHDTFVAAWETPAGPRRFVVQCINTHVFRDPGAVMDNLLRVTEHQRRALARAGAADAERRALRVVPTRDGRAFQLDDAGRPWRCFPFVEGTVSHERPAHPGQAHEAARAFGAFVACLADLPPPRLHVTIPGFHDLAGRRAAFEAAVAQDAVGRTRSVAAEIDATRAWLERAATLADESTLPRRPVHNDCKLNNLLFDAVRDEALCVVDLDTAMDGSVVHDFGELVRTATCLGAEDERDLAGMRVELPLHEALARGFVEGAGALLTPEEREALADAGTRMALENAVRFLTDHLEGDVYFRVKGPTHNLDRQRAQLRLADLLFAERATLERHVRATGR
jgi:Ser/Thr protein kinase RdoA (MazF antagonist)